MNALLLASDYFLKWLAKQIFFSFQNDPDLAVSPQDGMNGTPSSMATRASSDDAFYDAMDDDFIQVSKYSIHFHSQNYFP